MSAAISSIATLKLLRHVERTRVELGRLVLLGHSGPLSFGLSWGTPNTNRKEGIGRDRHLKFYETRDNLEGSGRRQIGRWLPRDGAEPRGADSRER